MGTLVKQIDLFMTSHSYSRHVLTTTHQDSDLPTGRFTVRVTVGTLMTGVLLYSHCKAKGVPTHNLSTLQIHHLTSLKVRKIFQAESVPNNFIELVVPVLLVEIAWLPGWQVQGT